MTATERLFRGDSDEYMSMDDPRDYGDLIYELSFKKAINSKPPIISDYKIITFGITTPEIEKIAEDNKYLEVKKDLKDNPTQWTKIKEIDAINKELWFVYKMNCD